MEARTGSQDWQDWAVASELVVVLLAFVMTFILFSGQNIGRLNPFGGSPTSPSVQATSSQLRVTGTGTEAPADSSSALQGATPLQQSGESGKNLQRNAGEAKQLQPNEGQSTFPQKQPLQ